MFKISDFWMDPPFQRAVKRAGIDDFRFHDLRHAAASFLVMKGIDLLKVQRILGHKDSRMTQRYAHLSPSHLRGAAKVMDEVLGTTLGTTRGPGEVVNLEKPRKQGIARMAELADALD